MRASPTSAVTAAALLIPIAAGAHALVWASTFNTEPTTTPGPSAVAPAETPPDRVVLVVVDGAGIESADLLGLGRPDAVLRAAWPTYSRPNYVTLLTGAPPTVSGVHTNAHRGSAGLESLPELARRSGRTTALVTDGIDWWLDLFPGAFQTRSTDAASFDVALAAALGSPAPSFVLVHVVAIDEAAHDHGRESPAHRAAAALAAVRLAAIRATLDPARDVLLVTADHGHIRAGGHGGPEPEVVRVPLWLDGPGTRNAEGATGHLADVPPTLASLSGLPAPSASTGRSLDALLDPKLPRHGPRVEAPSLRPPSPPGGALAGLAWALAATALLWPLRRQLRVRHVIVALSLPAAWWAATLLLEPALSFSAINDRGPWTRAVLLRTTAVTTAVFLATIRLRRRDDDVQAAARDALVLACGALPWLVTTGLYGAVTVGPALGDARLAFLVPLCAVAAAASGALALAFRLMRRR